ncbi:MAG TPA: lipoprotein [Pseudomonadales bacterium]|nr:lipoprotein [Pseudomonadales bacterium]
MARLNFETGIMLLRIFTYLVLCTVLAACGQSGALYRPDNTEPQQTPTEAE